MTDKRTIRGERYNISELVDSATATVDGQTLDTDAARNALARLGHRNPADAVVQQYARESAILSELERSTGAHFGGQIGKISFANRDRAIDQVNAYLNRRIAGQRSRWGK